MVLSWPRGPFRGTILLATPSVPVCPAIRCVESVSGGSGWVRPFRLRREPPTRGSGARECKLLLLFRVIGVPTVLPRSVLLPVRGRTPVGHRSLVTGVLQRVPPHPQGLGVLVWRGRRVVLSSVFYLDSSTLLRSSRPASSRTFHTSAAS